MLAIACLLFGAVLLAGPGMVVAVALASVAGVSLAYGTALVTLTSTFIVTFVAAACVLQPMRLDQGSASEAPLAERTTCRPRTRSR